MAAFFITGLPGSGKTTVLKELSARGYTTMDADTAPRLAGWIDIETGHLIAEWSPEVRTAPEGAAWGWDRFHLAEIVANPPGDPFFFGGNTSHPERFYQLFTKVFALALDDEILIRQLTDPNRDNPNHYGTQQKHIDETRAANVAFRERQSEYGAVVIEASRPIPQLADEIARLSLAAQ